MPPQVLICHGSGGTNTESWFPWLKQELTAQGYSVLCPQFPNTPADQNLENWLSAIKDYDLAERAIAIGHSLGGAFLLSLLEQRKFEAAYFVAGFASPLGNQFDEVTKTFVEKDFNWPQVRVNCRNCSVYFSDDDPYVMPEKAYEIARNTGGTPILIENAGHFNDGSAFTHFPELLDQILEEFGSVGLPDAIGIDGE